jgi:hypothetical protein
MGTFPEEYETLPPGFESKGLGVDLLGTPVDYTSEYPRETQFQWKVLYDCEINRRGFRLQTPSLQFPSYASWRVAPAASRRIDRNLRSLPGLRPRISVRLAADESNNFDRRVARVPNCTRHQTGHLSSGQSAYRTCPSGWGYHLGGNSTSTLITGCWFSIFHPERFFRD